MSWKIKTVVLSFILAIGFLLRSYNMNLPSIGYHSLKENEYLGIAQEMLKTGDFTHKRVYFHNAFLDNPVRETDNQPPMVSYQTILAWKLLGENFWSPRLVNILFGVLSILIIYLISALIFEQAYLSLFCAGLLSIMPLAVFFSRNIQQESPAFFFMLCGNLFYLRFVRSAKKYNLFLGGASFLLAWAYGFNFLFGAMPLLFCLPLRGLFAKNKEGIKYFLALALPYSIVLFLILKLYALGEWHLNSFRLADLLSIFSPGTLKNYLRPALSYARQENFTPVFLASMLFGVLIALFRKKDLLGRYIAGWALTSIAYYIAYSRQIAENNFYQMPFLTLVCVATAYSVGYVSEKIRKVIRISPLLFFMLLILGASSPFVYKSILRAHATLFFGMDVAGESLRELTQPDERVFLLTHAQGRGIARYAHRYMGWPAGGIADFKSKEEKFNIKYICFYPAQYAQSLKSGDPSLFEYIRDNYHAKEAGLLEGSQIAYVILEKGKGSDPKTFLESFSGPMQVNAIYKVFGKFVFFYAMAPQEE